MAKNTGNWMLLGNQILVCTMILFLAAACSEPQKENDNLPDMLKVIEVTDTAPPAKIVDVEPVQTETSQSPTEALSCTETAPPVQMTQPAGGAPRGERVDPFDLVSQESLFSYLTELTAIQAYSGWRNSATLGEAEALDYVAGQFEKFEFLQTLGVQFERQSFPVYNSTEIWDSRLSLTVAGEPYEVPADGLRGQRDDNGLAVRFDSDGVIGDSNLDPVSVSGAALLINSVNQLAQLSAGDASGKIIFLDFDVIHPNVLGDIGQALAQSETLLSLQPAGLVLVTQFSDEPGLSHGAFIGDGQPLANLAIGPDAPAVPTLYVRLEDLADLGMNSWEDLALIESANLVWDADVIAPAESGNLAVTIPGADHSKTLILSAHIDSPNNPGAMDDGSGSATLLEVARVLDQAQIKPAFDLMLIWYGSEELGDYGSAHFVATHQELLDHTLAVLQIDCLTRPMDGVGNAHLELVTWSFGHLGDESLPWPEFLSAAVQAHGVDTLATNRYAVESDNTPFGGFDVPNANLIYTSNQMGAPLHFKAHIHSPYDTVELAYEARDVLEQMALTALTAAMADPRELEGLRVTPRAQRRALFLGNHNEAASMSPVGLTEFGMALALEGYDVDLLPYGQPLTEEDLADADLVVALPVYDYSIVGAVSEADEAWSLAEIDLLEAYVRQGGFLVVTNSAHRLKFHNWYYDQNENWRKMNAVVERFGLSYGYGTVDTKNFWVEKIGHPLLEGISYMELIPDNAIPLRLTDGIVLAYNIYRPVIVLVNAGEGQVLVLADLGILGNLGQGTPENLPFWINLARYAQ